MPENTPLEKHQQIKVWNAEDWLYEEFEVGRKDRSHPPDDLRGRGDALQ